MVHNLVNLVHGKVYTVPGLLRSPAFVVVVSKTPIFWQRGEFGPIAISWMSPPRLAIQPGQVAFLPRTSTALHQNHGCCSVIAVLRLVPVCCSDALHEWRSPISGRTGFEASKPGPDVEPQENRCLPQETTILTTGMA
ncbi:hypothetical protein C8J57DRAFT_1465591 [Mycena rebaudengoi]|nr:hypothetical protein C8J57DRAFT_1465591 [Mycena rebaudengoi]